MKRTSLLSGADIQKLMLAKGWTIRDVARYWGVSDLLPIFSASVKLVESVFSKENGREEAVFGRADHWVPEAG